MHTYLMFVGFLASLVCASVRISGDTSSPVISYAQTLLNERVSILVGEASSPQIEVQLVVDPQLASHGNEWYRLDVKKGNVHISAAEPVGVLYGAVAFIEWVIGQTTSGLIDKTQVDIDFIGAPGVKPGQAAAFLNNLPDYLEENAPVFPWRGLQLHILALGVMDLIDVGEHEKKFCLVSGNPGGFKDSVNVWKKWVDWAARHRMNYITNWPYAAGTNWWELANDPQTAAMTIYSKEDIEKAAVIRESLFKYAKDRGVKPFLMNYVAGAPTPTIRRNFPQMVGVSPLPHYPEPFCLASPELEKLFRAQMKAIVRTYPSLAGFHLRWWGESFPCHCDKCKDNIKDLQQNLTLAMIEAAIEERPNIQILISGWFRMGGTPEFAAKLPKGNVVIQSKWGIDWEPTRHPDIPMDKIAELKHPFLISQNFPAEEFHSVGGVHYGPTQTGMREYYNAYRAGAIPNLSGLSICLGEKDYEWITGMNFLAAAKLNWSVEKTDVDKLAQNFVGVNSGFETAELVCEALDTTQKVFDEFSHDFDGIIHFGDCWRFYLLFGFKRIETMNLRELRAALPLITYHAALMNETADKIGLAKKLHQGQGAEFFKDVCLQTLIFADFFESRRLMVEAFIAKHLGKKEAMAAYLKTMRHLDERILEQVNHKPNISDDFEFDGMTTPQHENAYIMAEIRAIDEILKTL